MIRLVHGFNVWDGGASTIDRFKPFLPPPIVEDDYGWTFLIGVRFRNAEAVERIAREIQPGTVLIGHSNGALICWKVAQLCPDKILGVVTINAALRRDTLWPPGIEVLNLYNPFDLAVLVGRWWSRLVSLGGIRRHGWGAAGRYGFSAGQANVRSVDTSSEVWQVRAARHSGIFSPEAARHWGRFTGRWVEALILRRERSSGLK